MGIDKSVSRNNDFVTSLRGNHESMTSLSGNHGLMTSLSRYYEITSKFSRTNESRDVVITRSPENIFIHVPTGICNTSLEFLCMLSYTV